MWATPSTLSGAELLTSIEEITETATVHNIEVKDNHNYFAEGILVHNKAPIFPSSGSWCPFVYRWDGTNFIEENNLLPESTDYARATLDVVDNYMFQAPLAEVNGSYTIQLNENWTERTNFDEFRLITVDYPPEYTGIIDIDEFGQIETANDTVAPEYAFDNEGGNQLWMVGTWDNIAYEGLWNDTLTMNFDIDQDIINPKLVVRHKTDALMVKPNIYWPNPLDDPNLKCSIHVQIYEDGWVDVGTIPARVNWVTDIVNLSTVSDYLKLGGEIRFYITGRHYIDYIGLDVSDEQVQFEVSYLVPVSVQYEGIDNAEMVSRVLASDGSYLQMNPGQRINIRFPYIPNESRNRAFALMVSGHYYTIPMQDIVQPVTIEATVTGSSTGSITVAIEEMAGSTNYRPLIGQTVDLSNGNNAYIAFEQKTEKNYRLAINFDDCAIGTKVTIVLSSQRGAQTLEFINTVNTATHYLLNDALWNVTGARFDPLTGRYQTLKNTPLKMKISENYNWNLTDCDVWEWKFGDGTWSLDVNPTHAYQSPGICVLNLTLSNNTYAWSYSVDVLIEVVEEPPVPAINAYQEMNLFLSVTGRKGNSVGIRIYEYGILIHSANVTRTAGQPDTVTLELDKYLGKFYEVELVYDAAHRGANPTWLEFCSGDANLTFVHEFNTDYGYCQIVPVPDSYLEDVAASNPTYRFDASDSYDIDGEIVSYEWDFGDGTVAQGIAAEHTYTAPGTYEVTLTVTDDDGLASTVSMMVTYAVPVTTQPLPGPSKPTF